MSGASGSRQGARRMSGAGITGGRGVSPVLVALAASAALLVATPASAFAASRIARARLQGKFLVQGHVTSAQNVRGEHAGETVLRTWTFTPTCATGACPTVNLVRRRAHASDQVTLHRHGAGYYVGNGIFYAPLRCGGRVYKRGWAVPFKLKVRITLAVVSGHQVIATRISATYLSRARRNRTPCVVAPAHDAASYHGHLV